MTIHFFALKRHPQQARNIPPPGHGHNQERRNRSRSGGAAAGGRSGGQSRSSGGADRAVHQHGYYNNSGRVRGQ